jgi:hypothetical protein
VCRLIRRDVESERRIRRGCDRRVPVRHRLQQVGRIGAREACAYVLGVGPGRAPFWGSWRRRFISLAIFRRYDFSLSLFLEDVELINLVSFVEFTNFFSLPCLFN